MRVEGECKDQAAFLSLFRADCKYTVLRSFAVSFRLGYLFVEEHARRLGISTEALRGYLKSLDFKIGHRVVVVSDGSSLVSMHVRIPARVEGPVVVKLLEHQRPNPQCKNVAWGNDPIKHTGEQFEEQIMVDAGGQVLEGTSSNVFVVYPGPDKTKIVQTAPDDLVLPGTMRQVVLEALGKMPNVKVVLEPFNVKDLSSSVGMFLSSTSRLVLPVNKVVTDSCTVSLTCSQFLCHMLMPHLQELLANKYLS